MDDLYEFDEKLFPVKWHGEVLSAYDVEYYLCKDNIAHQLQTKSAIGNPNWKLNKLVHLITTKGKSSNEKWRLPEEDLRLLVWQAHRHFSSPPDAIMSFDIWVVEKTKTNKPVCIFLTNNLMWVNPKKRKKGLGSHLIAHFICYLLDCKVYYPLVSRKGVDIVYYADYYSKGGEALSNYICSYLKYMRDAWTLEHHNVGWPIKSVEIDAGFLANC